jgi:non-heme chloroperoxidase
MQRTIALISATVALAGGSLRAQDIAGVWQGTITDQGTPLRQVLRLARADTGWRALFVSLDLASDTLAIRGVALKGRDVVITFGDDALGIADARTTYQGTLSRDGRSITGSLIDSDGRYPLNFKRVSGRDIWPLPAPHTIRFVAADTNVKLEVLDWGGSGPPLVFLAGLGNTAHVFDQFATKFTSTHHVYGITRRGFGASSKPAPTPANYAADRLGDDVLAVIDSLGLKRPVLAGHSIAGEELSSIGSRFPDRVAGLVYLDAGYSYAFYDPARGDYRLDRQDLQRVLARLRPGYITQTEFATLIRALRDSILPRFEMDVRRVARNFDVMRPRQESTLPDTTPNPGNAVGLGEARYSRIPVPILAIFAFPRRRLPPPPGADSMTDQARTYFDSLTATDITAFERGVPTARVVRIPNSTHFVFQSNEAEVLREMNTFLVTVSH